MLNHKKNQKIININEKFCIYKNYFLEQEIEDYFYTVDYFFFNSSSEKDIYFQLYDKKLKKIIGIFFVNYINGSFVSQGKGTFGGFLSLISNFEVQNLFIKETLDHIICLKPKEIIIKMAPTFYDIQNFTNITNILLRSNFKITEFNLNHFMKVEKKISYENIISKGNLKKLKKSYKKYKIKEDCFNQLEEIYNVLDINRKSKGNKLSLDFKNIQAICKSFQKYIKIFSAIDENEKIIATAFCIMINKKVLYVFYWGELPEVKNYSPVVFLSEAIFNFCKKNNYEFIDIGTSSIKSEPNIDLIKFKERIGYIAAPKISLILKNKYE
jgi:hypothetical protein